LILKSKHCFKHYGYSYMKKKLAKRAIGEQ
jgi:hypothetical protein